MNNWEHIIDDFGSRIKNRYENVTLSYVHDGDDKGVFVYFNDSLENSLLVYQIENEVCISNSQMIRSEVVKSSNKWEEKEHFTGIEELVTFFDRCYDRMWNQDYEFLVEMVKDLAVGEGLIKPDKEHFTREEIMELHQRFWVSAPELIGRRKE